MGVLVEIGLPMVVMVKKERWPVEGKRARTIC
jgi:hypothetical protein